MSSKNRQTTLLTAVSDQGLRADMTKFQVSTLDLKLYTKLLGNNLVGTNLLSLNAGKMATRNKGSDLTVKAIG